MVILSIKISTQQQISDENHSIRDFKRTKPVVAYSKSSSNKTKTRNWAVKIKMNTQHTIYTRY